MKKLAFLVLAANVAGCAAPFVRSGIREYGDLWRFVGQEVTLVGYWSAQHEAQGIYFGKRRYRYAPRQCVAVDPPPRVQHQSAVRVRGTLERSGCGDDLICLTVCQPLVLTNARLAR
ncbi:MAG TPA: hypothetical protein VGC35_11860 [Allosphingosinicella sp.]|jgi:hypothetical protein